VATSKRHVATIPSLQWSHSSDEWDCSIAVVQHDSNGSADVATIPSLQCCTVATDPLTLADSLLQHIFKINKYYCIWPPNTRSNEINPKLTRVKPPPICTNAATTIGSSHRKPPPPSILVTAGRISIARTCALPLQPPLRPLTGHVHCLHNPPRPLLHVRMRPSD
jgi:hypothetical protein